MTQIKAFDPYVVGKELKRNQPSQETLQVQEQLLNSIIEAREEELKEKLKRELSVRLTILVLQKRKRIKNNSQLILRRKLLLNREANQ